MITIQQFVDNMAFAIHESDQLDYLTDEFMLNYLATDIEDGDKDILKLTTVLGDTVEFAEGFYINGRFISFYINGRRLRSRMGYGDI